MQKIFLLTALSAGLMPGGAPAVFERKGYYRGTGQKSQALFAFFHRFFAADGVVDLE